MPSAHEEFWNHGSFALVGHSAAKNFPTLTYRGLKARGKTVFPVDPSVSDVDGDRTYPDLESLPTAVEAVVLEVPRDETAAWIGKAADAGIRAAWIHMTRDTPEAVALARERGMHVLTGTCAVMYLSQGFSVHTMHGWLNRLFRKY